MKTCFKCGACKPLVEFYKHPKMVDGHLGKCKCCTKADVKKNETRYDLTEKGVVRVIYKTQKRSNVLRGFGVMPYSKQDLSQWLYNSGFKSLYDKWVACGYKSGDKPSVDRIDDFQGYSFENIKLSTWGKNREHQHSDIRAGAGTSGGRCKAVDKSDSDGNLIATYVSRSAAARESGYSIDRQLKTGIKCRNDFFWSYL